MIVTVIIFLMLAGSFACIYVCSKNSLAYKNKYPKVNCIEIIADYRGRPTTFEFDAVAEFKLNSEAEVLGLETHFTGAMQCFCQDQHKAGKSKNEMY